MGRAIIGSLRRGSGLADPIREPDSDTNRPPNEPKAMCGGMEDLLPGSNRSSENHAEAKIILRGRLAGQLLPWRHKWIRMFLSLELGPQG
jgi:hypothetical protein